MMMNQIEPSISYLIYPQENDFFNQKLVDEQKRNINMLFLPNYGQYSSLMIPNNMKMNQFLVSDAEQSNMNQYENINSNGISLNYTYEPYSSPIIDGISKTPNTSTSLPSPPARRSRWTNDEEELLIKLVKKTGARKWNQIASLLKTKTAKQCRDHYANCLDPSIKNSLWSDEEDKILLKKYKEYGPHWSRIKKFLPGRTTSNIKNYISMLIKKKTRGYSNKNRTKNISYPKIQKDDVDSPVNISTNSSNDDVEKNIIEFNYLDICCLLNPPKVE